MKKLKIIGLVAVLGLALGGTAFAAEFIAPDKHGSGTIDLPSSETHNNLHVVGGILNINSKIGGDLYAAGGIVKVTGDIENSVLIAGGRIDLDANVGKNAHIGGGTVQISKTIGGDLVVGGGTVFLTENSIVNGDLVVGGGEVIVNGTVSGNLLVSASDKLSFGEKSVVTGKITYYGNNDPIIANGAKIGSIDRHALKGGMHHRGLFGVGMLIALIAGFLTTWLLSYLFKPQLGKATMMMRSEPWANLGIGLIALIVTPILFILLLITLVGYYIAFIAIAIYLTTLLLSSLVAAVFLGQWLYGYFDKTVTSIDWRVVLTGVVAYRLIIMVPILGWIVGFLLCMTAFGALLRMLKHQTDDKSNI